MFTLLSIGVAGAVLLSMVACEAVNDLRRMAAEIERDLDNLARITADENTQATARIASLEGRPIHFDSYSTN